jgi:hypothetical protein
LLCFILNIIKKTHINSTDIVKEVVQAEILMKIIIDNCYNCQIDYFQFNTEGFDFEIIKMADLAKCKPKIIKYKFK